VIASQPRDCYGGVMSSILDVPSSRARIRTMKTHDRICFVVAIAFVFSTFSSFAQDKPPADPPELAARRDDLNRAVQRATVPLLTNYLRSLDPLKQQFTREGKLDAALAVDNEMRAATEQLKNAQGVANGANRPNAELLGTWRVQNESDGTKATYDIIADKSFKTNGKSTGMWEVKNNQLILHYDRVRFERYDLPPHSGLLKGANNAGQALTLTHVNQ
jgi:hypothetical protein